MSAPKPPLAAVPDEGDRNQPDDPMTPLGSLKGRGLKLLERRASEAPAAGPEVCPRCFGAGMEVVPQKGARRCECKLQEWVVGRVEKMFPKKYRAARLADMQPDPGRHWKQADAIRLVRNNPFDNYHIHGTFGTGKSHLMWAMARNALESRRQVWAGNLEDLLVDFQRVIEASQQGGSHRPALRAEMMRGQDWTLCFDAVDFAKMTEWRMSQLGELIDAAYREEQQIVIVSNLDEYQLRRKWDAYGEQYGGAIMRRILEGSREIYFPPEGADG